MRNFTWNRFPIKNLLINSLLTPIVESTYLSWLCYLKFLESFHLCLGGEHNAGIFSSDCTWCWTCPCGQPALHVSFKQKNLKVWSEKTYYFVQCSFCKRWTKYQQTYSTFKDQKPKYGLTIIARMLLVIQRLNADAGTPYLLTHIECGIRTVASCKSTRI